MKCRGCCLSEETQKHILEECPKLHETDTTEITIHEICSDNTETAGNTDERKKRKKGTARKLKMAVQKVGKHVQKWAAELPQSP